MREEEPGDKPDNMPQADQSGVAQRKRGKATAIFWAKLAFPFQKA